MLLYKWIQEKHIKLQLIVSGTLVIARGVGLWSTTWPKLLATYNVHVHKNSLIAQQLLYRVPIPYLCCDT